MEYASTSLVNKIALVASPSEARALSVKVRLFPDAHMPLSVGDKLGPYEILAPISSGRERLA